MTACTTYGMKLDSMDWDIGSVYFIKRYIDFCRGINACSGVKAQKAMTSPSSLEDIPGFTDRVITGTI